MVLLLMFLRPIKTTIAQRKKMKSMQKRQNNIITLFPNKHLRRYRSTEWDNLLVNLKSDARNNIYFQRKLKKKV